jgi:opacity protein-like surface antigen
MKKLLVAAIAAAVFLNAPALAGPPAGVFDWSGFYLGGHAGHGGGNEDWTWIPGIGPLRQDTGPSGFVRGAQAGWQQQWNNIVGGIELAWSDGDLKSSQTSPVFAGGPRQFNSKLDSIFTAAGRLGVAQNNWLLYGKGGFASGEVRQGIIFVPNVISNGDEKAERMVGSPAQASSMPFLQIGSSAWNTTTSASMLRTTLCSILLPMEQDVFVARART